jgi:predicted ATPase/DNA-binding SARP family transcriptional activator
VADPEAQLVVRILGPLDVVAGGARVALGGHKQRAVLALLATRAGTSVSTDTLIESLWPERPPATATTTVQVYVSRLRKLVGPGAIVSEAGGYRLCVDGEYLDAVCFERLARRGSELRAAGRAVEAATAFAEALSLWRGSALADFSFEGWAQAPIGRLEELRVSAIEDRIEADLASGRHAELVGELESLIAEHPLRERLRGQLMLALYRGGRQADALKAYQAARQMLIEELGIEPSPELQSLNHSILNQDKALAAPPRAAARRGPVKLPVPATPLVGRRRELAELKDLLGSEDTRLLTLTGPGGTGKTRLALSAAEEAAPSFPDGVHWVGLAALRDPSLVAATVAHACAVSEIPGVPLTDTIVRSFVGKRMIVLLDNCEHLAEGVATLAAPLVEQCPELVVMASSRERLGLRSELVYAVPPMEPEDAEELFIKRARAIQADFEPDEHISAVCSAVDGLPLAVELAAARVRSLSTHAIRDRLNERLSLLATRDRDVEERQRTLEATMAWSYGLLAADEQRAFRALSVFVGGCTLEAAEQVAGANLDLIESLLDKSLIRHRVDIAGQDRYWMLETIREFAARELDREQEMSQMQDRQVAWVLQVVRAVAPGWTQPPQHEMVQRLEADEANIRLSLTRAISKSDGDRALELVGLIGQAWIDSGRLMEIRRWAQEALALHGSARLEGMALLSSGWSDIAEGSGSFEAAATRFHEFGMSREAAYATMSLGLAQAESGSVDQGLEALEHALGEFERLGDEYCGSITRWNMAGVRGLRWPLEPAEARGIVDTLREAASESHRMGATGDEIACFDMLSHALIDAGELEEAWSTALDAAALIQDAQAGRHVLVSVGAALARAAGLRGNAEQSLLLATGVRAVSNELGVTMAAARASALEAAEAASRGTVDSEAGTRATATGEAMTVDLLLDYLATLR